MQQQMPPPKLTVEVCAILQNIATRIGYVPRRRGMIDQIWHEVNLTHDVSIRSMNHQTNSPELAPNDYSFWGWMMNHVSCLHFSCLLIQFTLQMEKVWPPPDTIEALEERIRAAWDAMPMEFVRNTIDAQVGRVQLCVENNGGHIAKWRM
jgi:hypothetical protein